MVSPHGLTNERVLDIIKKNHPELDHRLITGPGPVFSVDRWGADFARIEEVTGMRKQDFHTLEEVRHCLDGSFLNEKKLKKLKKLVFQTISDTVNDLLKLEDEWKRNGYSSIEIPKSPFQDAVDTLE